MAGGIVARPSLRYSGPDLLKIINHQPIPDRPSTVEASMTANQILRVTAGTNYDRKALRQAAEAVERFVAAGGEIFIGSGGSDDATCHYAVIEDMAREELVRRDTLRHLQELDAEDAAVDHYAPQIDAAFYFGFALGLKMSGGAQ
jgi:hypothetical protein